jgi:hypothetical protein
MVATSLNASVHVSNQRSLAQNTFVPLRRASVRCIVRVVEQCRTNEQADASGRVHGDKSVEYLQGRRVRKMHIDSSKE